MPLPETILQFGSGRFLRAFADLFIDNANQQGQNIGSVVLVQSTGGERAGALSQQGGKFHVVIRGLENGQVVDRVEEVGSISQALVANSQWEEVRKVARSPELRFVLSNTTEAGYTLDETDKPTCAPPKSFPAKLLLLLQDRYEAKLPWLTIIVRTHEGNAGLLRTTLLAIAEKWSFAPAFRDWLANECVWLHTLSIASLPRAKEHPLLRSDRC